MYEYDDKIALGIVIGVTILVAIILKLFIHDPFDAFGTILYSFVGTMGFLTVWWGVSAAGLLSD